VAPCLFSWQSWVQGGNYRQATYIAPVLCIPLRHRQKLRACSIVAIQIMLYDLFSLVHFQTPFGIILKFSSSELSWTSLRQIHPLGEQAASHRTVIW
jgi:hypothetical protein